MKRSTMFLGVLCVLLLAATLITGCGGKKEDKKQSDEWPASGLATMLPQPEKGNLSITFDWDDRFSADIEDTDKDTFKKYVEDCKSKGFTVEAQESSSSVSRYEAYDSDGYKLELMMVYDDEFSILLAAPEKMESISWPSVGPATYIPEPKSKTGKIKEDSSDCFSVLLGESSKEDYGEYVGWCFDYGYDVDYENNDDSYRAYNVYGVLVEVRYEGNNMMSINVETPEETTSAETIAPATETPAETQVPETQAPETQAPETQGDSGIIRPEIKEAIDSYEAFIDEYCEFMKNYNASDLTMLAKYAELVGKELEMTKQFDAIENEDLNDAESLYFAEVSLRCSQKLNETAISIGN